MGIEAPVVVVLGVEEIHSLMVICVIGMLAPGLLCNIKTVKIK